MPVTITANKVDPRLVPFKPRQVLLGSSSMKHSNGNDNKALADRTLSLNLDQKLLLHQSIDRYLEKSGLRKTLKKFRSEAQIETDDLKVSLIDLEVTCLTYLEKCKDAKITVNNRKEQDEKVKKNSRKDGEGDLIADVENTSRKKKSHKSDQSGAAESCKNPKNSEEMTNDADPKSNKSKEKKEKKKKI